MPDETTTEEDRGFCYLTGKEGIYCFTVAFRECLERRKRGEKTHCEDDPSLILTDTSENNL